MNTSVKPRIGFDGDAKIRKAILFSIFEKGNIAVFRTYGCTIEKKAKTQAIMEGKVLDAFQTSTGIARINWQSCNYSISEETPT